MERSAREKLYSEDENWLNSGRTMLMSALLMRASRLTGAIEGPVLDIGAGSGHAIDKLVEYGEVDAVERAEEAWPLIAQRPIRHLYKCDVPDAAIVEKYGIITALEVLEHIERDQEAFSWMADRLKPGGVIVVTVPAYQWLFGPHDIANHHFRRYTRDRLLSVMPNQLEPLGGGYFMTSLFPAALAMRLAYNVQANKDGQVTKKQSSNVPRILDSIFRGILYGEARLAGSGIGTPFGLTVYLLARRNR